MSWTEKQLQDKQKAGKIRGYKAHKRGEKYPHNSGNNIPVKPSKEKIWLAWNLLYWANENSLELKTEFKFNKERKWKNDWAIPSMKILMEYEGLVSKKSRHTTLIGYSGDTDKYREASKSGWIVLRYTAINFKTVLQDLNSLLKK